MAELTIYIGNRNYSSWSFRAWLMLKATGAEFEEVLIPLGQPTTRAMILKYSPSGRLPALKAGDLTVWESLAIGEFLAERYPEAKLWPDDATARAVARSASTEMHAGFQALRQYLPMNIRSTFPNRRPTPEVQADINRILAIWLHCRERFGAGGPFLFGHFTIADAMFAPVVSRFRTYKIPIPEPVCEAYAESVAALPAYQEWAAAAEEEPMVIDEAEF